MTEICIVGAGVTGLSLLLLLQEEMFDLSKVAIIDPHFDGGDLARLWTSVRSNTPWSKTINAIKTACPSLNATYDEFDPDKTTKLVDLAHLLCRLTKPILKKVRQIQGTVIKAEYSSDWKITIEAGGKSQELHSTKVVFVQGGEPRKMDLPIASIPLEIALDSNRIQHYVKNGERAIVFGTLHSGCLVIKNLVSAGVNVTAFYNTSLPFYWQRDGVYDGIKEEAADIADDIVSGKIPTELVSVNDSSKLIRSAHTANWVVYAMGFKARNTIYVGVEGEQKHIQYNGTTGKMENIPAAWGFGVAYPNLAPDGVHWDVSIAAFLEHMKKQLPSILHS
jgi:hypothetical protein